MTDRQLFGLFLLFWIAQSIITALNTELYFDEAYYWMYSQFLAWGYFDHPPVVAVIIWLGSFLGKNELAVRLVNVLMMAGILSIIYYVVKPKNTLVFCLTLFSFLTFHLSGFVTLPDTPFLFFALVFMLAYRTFLQDTSWYSWVALGAAAALMLYSKYHGVLVILFVILSNIRLLANARFYLAGLVGVIVFLPHIWWQVSHDFPSLQYHLIDRGSSYKLSQTLDYVFGNVPYHGGLVSIALLIASFGYRATNYWERALKWNLYGTFIFFFLITFRGQYIEPNWTIFCIIPLLYLGYRRVEEVRWFRTYRVLAAVFAGILLLIKVHLNYPLVDIKKDRVWDFHLSRNFARTVEQLAGDDTIVANDYKVASLLNFYAGQDYYIPALNIEGRANQYSIWQLDTMLCNKDIAFVNQHLSGTAVEGRMHRTENVTKLEQVTSLNLLSIQDATLAIDQQTATVTLSVVSSSDQPCEYHDTLSLEFTLLHSGTPVLTHQEPLATTVMPIPTQTYQIPITDGQPVDKVLIRAVSTKLGGGNNQYVTLSVD